MTRSPNDEGDEVTRQKMQAMAKDGSLRVTSDGAPSSAPTNETGPAMRPGFLSTDQYNMGLAIVSGEKAPLTRDPPRPAAGHAAPPRRSDRRPRRGRAARRDPRAKRRARRRSCAAWVRSPDLVAARIGNERRGDRLDPRAVGGAAYPPAHADERTRHLADRDRDRRADRPTSLEQRRGDDRASTSPTPSATAAAPRLTSSAAATAPPSSTAPYDPGDLMFKRKKNP